MGQLARLHEGDAICPAGEVYVPESSQWYLRNTNSEGAPDLSFQYGWPGVLPVVGDWNGDKVTTVGVYDPDAGHWLLRNSPGGGPADQ